MEKESAVEKRQKASATTIVSLGYEESCHSGADCCRVSSCRGNHSENFAPFSLSLLLYVLSPSSLVPNTINFYYCSFLRFRINVFLFTSRSLPLFLLPSSYFNASPLLPNCLLKPVVKFYFIYFFISETFIDGDLLL